MESRIITLEEDIARLMRRKTRKDRLIGFSAAYVLAGAVFATMLSKIPAATWLAIALMVLLWPTHIAAFAFDSQLPLIWLEWAGMWDFSS